MSDCDHFFVDRLRTPRSLFTSLNAPISWHLFLTRATKRYCRLGMCRMVNSWPKPNTENRKQLLAENGKEPNMIIIPIYNIYLPIFVPLPSMKVLT